MFFAGLALLTLGVWRLYGEIAFITCGLILMFIGDRAELVRLWSLIRMRVPLRTAPREDEAK